MRVTLSTTMLDSLTSKGNPQKDYFDAPTAGLAIRVTKAGKKSWVFMFTDPTDDGRARVTFGTYPATPLKAARDEAERLRGLVEKGLDPRTVAAPKPKKTIAQLVDDYIRLVVRPDGDSYLRSCMAIERIFDTDVIPVVGHIAVEDFEVKDWNLVLDPIVERGAKVMGNRVFVEVRSLLRFGVQRGESKYNVLSELDEPHEENACERFLSLDEIVTFWTRCPAALVRSPEVQLILKLCLALGKRSNEVCGMKRAELDRGKRLWTIPKERVKGKNSKARDEQVPLSDLALELIEEACRRSNSEFVFPNDCGDDGYDKRVVAKAVRGAMGRFGMAKWTPHDLRRTVGTQMLNKANDLGITKEQKYLVLNHLSSMRSNVSDRVYDQNTYVDEKREAVEKWGAFLTRLVAPPAEQQEAA